MRVLRVVRPGPLTTVQDLGRPGRAADGVGVSGAADTPSFLLANRLVGNDERDACLEVTFGGLVLEAMGLVVVAITGATAPVIVDDRHESVNTVLFLRPGSRLCIGTPSAGARNYLAARGGVNVLPVLASRATDTLSGLGPLPLRTGDELPVGEPRLDHPVVEHAPVLGPRPAGEEVSLRFMAGPRHDWFAPDALGTLTQAVWDVGVDSNRVGVRLQGPVLRRRRTDELPSEGMVLGAIQVPPSGPVLFLADHPLTGGYPVIGVLDAQSVAHAAQLRAGGRVRLHCALPGGAT
jgi:biotin-dependent carboxylase-like uncharacterized protein